MTFNTGNAKGFDHCFIGDLGTMWGKTHLTGCIGEIIGFYRSLTDRNFTYLQIFNDEVGHQRLRSFQKVTSFLYKLPVSGVSNFL